MSELFVIATQNKFRFETVRGNVTVEQLWDMPLDQTKGQEDSFNLNEVARAISRQIKSMEEENFVTKKTSKDKLLSQKLDIVKFIIDVKLKEIESAKEAAERRILRDKARRILANREDSKLDELSDKELKKLAK